MRPFLTVDEFSSDKGGWFELDATLPPARLLPHIVETQRLRLRPLLGGPLLAELEEVLYKARLDAAVMNALTPELPATPYAELLPAAWATLWAAVRPLLGYATWARYLPHGQTTVTSHSVVVKTSEYSTPASSATINSQVVTLMESVQSYQADLVALLPTLAVPLAQWLPAQDGCYHNQASLENQGTVTTLFIRRDN